MAPALLALAVVACSPGYDAETPSASDSGQTSQDEKTDSPDPSEAILSETSVEQNAFQLLGEEVYASGQIDSAQILFGQALQKARQGGDSAAIARALTWLAQAAWRLGDYRRTRRVGEDALALKLRLGLQEELFRSYNVLGLLAWNQSRLLEAAALFGRATEIARASADSANLAKVRNNLALVHTSLGEFQEARQGFLDARALARALGELLIEGRVLINLAMLSTEMGDPRSAVAQIQEARPILQAAEDPVGELSALGHLGTAYSALGEAGRAVACLDSALHQARVHGLRQEEASNLEQMASLQSDAGNFRRALQLLEDAEEVNATLGLLDELATDLIAEARIRSKLGSFDRALEDARRALAIHREIQAPLREVEDLVVLAELSQMAGRHEEAVSFLSEADQIALNLGARTGRISTALGWARVAQQAGDPRRVLQTLDAAQTDLVQGGYDVEWETHSLRAQAYADLGFAEQSVDEGRRAIAAIERVRGAFSSGVLRDAYMKERAATYENQVAVLLDLGRVDEAFETADAARGRALLESIGAVGAPAQEGSMGLVGTLADGDRMLREIEELTYTLNELQATGAKEGMEDEVEADLQAQMVEIASSLGELRAEYGAALVRAEEHDPRGMALLGGTRLSTNDILSALRTGEALLEYLVGSEGVFLFVATPEGVWDFWSKLPRDRLAGRIRVATETLRNPGEEPGSGRLALERLHEVLVAPALRADVLSGVERLIIVTHGELSYLPFAALRNPEGRYLIEGFSLTHLPNAAGLLFLRKGQPQPPITDGGISAFAPFPRDLPGSAVELEVIREATPVARAYQGGRATEDRFREELTRAGIVHVATHGVMNARNPMFSHLQFAPGRNSARQMDEGIGTHPFADGRLEVHEILRAKVDASLVFLSGCETALGPGWSTSFGRGEEYATLAQAILHAGAENVLATLWRIDDPSAAVFARHFYSELGGGAPPVQALAVAQRAMLRESEFQRPFHWAAYRLMGTGDGLPAARTASGVR